METNNQINMSKGEILAVLNKTAKVIRDLLEHENDKEERIFKKNAKWFLYALKDCMLQNEQPVEYHVITKSGQEELYLYYIVDGSGFHIPYSPLGHKYYEIPTKGFVSGKMGAQYFEPETIKKAVESTKNIIGDSMFDVLLNRAAGEHKWIKKELLPYLLSESENGRKPTLEKDWKMYNKIME